jgi:hypothetical protein
MESTTTKLAPTVEAIDEWLGRQKPRADGSFHANDATYMVDVRTKAGSWRCITMRHSALGFVDGIDGPGWWTIRGEGSSNGSRETWVPARKVVEARGYYMPAWEYGSVAS